MNHISPYGRMLFEAFQPRPGYYGIASENAHGCDYCGNSDMECECQRCKECGEVFPPDDLTSGACADCAFDPKDREHLYDQRIDDKLTGESE